MNHQSKPYLITLLSCFIILSAQVAPADEPKHPGFVSIGNTYSTVISMQELVFTVEEIDGTWIKVKILEGPVKETSEDVWLNTQNLSIMICEETPQKSTEKD